MIKTITDKIDIAIIGAGPAGIACAIAAVKKKYRVRLVDKGNVADAIIRFPTQMIFFSTADLLELASVPFTSQNIRPTRLETVKYYHSLIRMFHIPVLLSTRVVQINKKSSCFEIHYHGKKQDQRMESRYVILATGFYDQPNTLNVPGEDRPSVSHYYKEPLAYFNQQVVVVGGGNSAVEAALELYRHGCRVTLVHRGTDIRESVKYWIKPDIQNRIKEKSIPAYFHTRVEKITDEGVMINQNGSKLILPADAVFIMTGFHPDESNYRMCQVNYDPVTLEPVCNHETLESDVPGLYLAGSVVAGRNTNKIFIENGREHGEIILADIQKKIKK